MKGLPFSLICQIYILLVLLAVTILSPLPYSPMALIFLAVMLFIMLRHLRPRLMVAIMVAVIFLLSLLLEPLLYYLPYTGPLSLAALQFLAAIATIPAIYILDYSLRQNAQDMTLAHNIKSRHLTSISRALLVSILAVLIVALILDHRVLLFTSIILVLYLLVILIKVIRTIPELPVDVSATGKKIIVGTTADISLDAISKAPIGLCCLLSPVEPWVKITPQRFTLNKTKMETTLTITPPLAGPSFPQLQVSVTDPRGFIQMNQVIEPVEVQVIPRAKYAEWLAMKYLEQTGVGGTAAVTMPPQAVLIPKRGIEYFDSRTYQPGDELRSIDWKHSLKLKQLIIKEYIEVGEQSAIIAVNLSVADVEEADRLAFNLITTVLTLAQEAIPTALAVYNHHRVILTTPVTAPREILKQALLLVKDITPVEFAHRYLQLPDISKLRRNIAQLKQVTSEPGQRLLSMLDFESQAIEQGAKNHPATLALSRIVEHVPPPAIIVWVSQLNHDAEALLVSGEKLTRRGFATLNLESAKP